MTPEEQAEADEQARRVDDAARVLVKQGTHPDLAKTHARALVLEQPTVAKGGAR